MNPTLTTAPIQIQAAHQLYRHQLTGQCLSRRAQALEPPAAGSLRGGPKHRPALPAPALTTAPADAPSHPELPFG